MYTVMFIVLSILVPMVQLYHWYQNKIVPMVQLCVLVNILLYINDDVIYCVFGTILYNLYKHKKPKPLQPPLGNAAREIA